VKDDETTLKGEIDVWEEEHEPDHCNFAISAMVGHSGNTGRCIAWSAVASECRYANLNPPQAVDQSLLIVNVPAGGWVDGARIKGKLLGPSGDWLLVMPSGVLRLDVRATIQTDDNELIYVSYNGVIQCSKEQSDR
jgi:hypothetical protein